MKNNKAYVRIRTNHPKEGFPESPAIIPFERKPSDTQMTASNKLGAVLSWALPSAHEAVGLAAE